MARRVLGSTGSGGGGGTGVINNLAIVDTEVFSDTLTNGMHKDTHAGMDIFDNNKFVYGTYGRDASRINAGCLAFNVDNNGVIATGGVATSNNSSGTAISTCYGGFGGSGSHVVIVRQYFYSSSYYITMPTNYRDSAGNSYSEMNTSGDYGNNYRHPGGGTTVPFGLGTGNTFHGYYGYNSSSYGGWCSYKVSTNGWNGQSLNSYSSTNYSGPVQQWHGDTSKKIGWGIDHRNSQSYNWNILYDSSGTATNYHIGNLDSSFGCHDTSLGGFAYLDSSNVSHKIVFSPRTGRGHRFNDSGSYLNSNIEVFNAPPTLNGNSANARCYMAGRNLMASVTGSSLTLYEITNPSTNNYTFVQKHLILSPAHAGLISQPNTNRGSFGLKLGGNELQFIVVAQPSGATTYDLASAGIDLSSYAS